MGYVGISNMAYIVLKITNNWKIKFKTKNSDNPSALFKSIILNSIVMREIIEIKKNFKGKLKKFLELTSLTKLLLIFLIFRLLQ